MIRLKRKARVLLLDDDTSLQKLVATLLRREGHRVDIEGPFGLLRAQLALALYGPRREEALSLILEEVAHAGRKRG